MAASLSDVPMSQLYKCNDCPSILSLIIPNYHVLLPALKYSPRYTTKDTYSGTHPNTKCKRINHSNMDQSIYQTLATSSYPIPSQTITSSTLQTSLSAEHSEAFTNDLTCSTRPGMWSCHNCHHLNNTALSVRCVGCSHPRCGHCRNV